MKLSKLYLYLGLTLIGLLSFIPSGCCSGGPISGGLADFSDPKAPKVIDSDNIRKFSLRFKYIGGIAKPAVENDCPPFPAGNYLLEAERKGDKAHFLLSCDRQGTATPLLFQKDLPVEALLDLQGIIRKYNLPAINGSSLRNSALGTSLSFEVLYDTDERLSVYAEGGVSTLPHGWCGTDVFLEFFLKKLDTEGLLFPHSTPAYIPAATDKMAFYTAWNWKPTEIFPVNKPFSRKPCPSRLLTIPWVNG